MSITAEEALRRAKNRGRFGETRGAVPTHAGGGTLLDGRDGIPVDMESVLLHDRALQILYAAHHAGMTYGDALRRAREEVAKKKLAEKKGTQYSEFQFNECAGICVDRGSVAVAKRANEIMAENNWPNSRFGEALRQARADVAPEGGD